MSLTRNVIFPSIIAVGLLALGLCIRSGFISAASKQRLVDVRGLAERTVMANEVTWPLSYTISGNDLPALYKECTEKDKIVLDFLTSNGIPTTDITADPPSVTQPYTWDKEAKYKYSLTSTLTVLTTQVDKVRELLKGQGTLLSQGIVFTNGNISYEYTDLNNIKPDMIAEATKNARLAAEQFAKDSNSELGKIKDASQGYFSITDESPSTPYIKNIRVVTSVTFFLKD